jgi:ABC-2 type transport system ATP-binding protein
MTDLAIRTSELTRAFGSVLALDGVSLEVPKGIIFGFLGPNGAGKTTTIRLLLGLLEPTSGRAEVLGLDTRTHAEEVRRRTGALLEHPGLYERLSAEANLDFHARARRLPASERRARIRELLERLGLWERRREPVGRWSRGMRQKLAVARALLHRPPLVFLDEPTAGLDPVAAAALRDDLARLAAHEGTTVFLTTHNLAEAEKLCARIAVIRRGRVVAVGRPEELRARRRGTEVVVTGRGFTDEVLERLRTRPEVRRAELADGRLALELRDDANAAPLVAFLVHAGVEVEEVHRASGSLEDAILALMEES